MASYSRGRRLELAAAKHHSEAVHGIASTACQVTPITLALATDPDDDRPFIAIT